MENKKKQDLSLFKVYNPEKAAGFFINRYLSNCNNEVGKKELEEIAEGISTLGLEKVLRIYNAIDAELKLNVKSENYEMAAKLKEVREYYKFHVIDIIPADNSSKTR